SATCTSGEPVSPLPVAYSAMMDFFVSVSSGTVSPRFPLRGAPGPVLRGTGIRGRFTAATIVSVRRRVPKPRDDPRACDPRPLTAPPALVARAPTDAQCRESPPNQHPLSAGTPRAPLPTLS